VLTAIGGRRALQAATVAAADREIARRATPAAGRAETDKAQARPQAKAGGAAMWRAAERRAATLYRRAFDDKDAAPEDPAVVAALERAGRGAPLPAGVRRKMEDALGMSLERVRVHSDAVAAEAARAVRAEAFTVGEDIFFAEHAYAPDSRAGQKLLAHELTHVVQGWQGRGEPAGAGVRVSQPSDSLEQEADAVAERVDRDEPARRADRDEASERRPGDRGGKPRSDARRGDARPDARPGEAAAPRGELKAPPPAQAAAPTSPRTLHRKTAARSKPVGVHGDATTIQPTFAKSYRPLKANKHDVANGRAEFSRRLGHAQQATEAGLAPLKKSIERVKSTEVGAKSKE
jgi:hypothetical protein